VGNRRPHTEDEEWPNNNNNNNNNNVLNAFYKLETISKTERYLTVIVNTARPQAQVLMTVPRFANFNRLKVVTLSREIEYG
jgi:hypothetical protein